MSILWYDRTIGVGYKNGPCKFFMFEGGGENVYHHKTLIFQPCPSPAVIVDNSLNHDNPLYGEKWLVKLFDFSCMVKIEVDNVYN